MSAGIHKQIREVLGPDGIPPSAMNEEFQDLINPSISARPLHLPEGTRIRAIINKEYHYHWAFDRCGSNPSHDRVERLRGAGWEYATSKDVDMFSADTVKGRNKDGFSNEIRLGDLRLMKIPEMRWREIRKAQNLAALDMINPRRPNSGPMALANMDPAMRHWMTSDEEVRKGAVIGKVEVENGEIKSVSGNASVARI